MPQPFTLPELPYAYDALEPVISAEIMKLHHDKHHAGYVNNLNKAVAEYAIAEEANDISKMIALQSAIKFNGGGHINHSIFWTNLAPIGKGGGGMPKGPLLDAINRDFGSFEACTKLMTEIATGLQGSGWCWLGYCPKTKRLYITPLENQTPLVTCNQVPLLGIDVWEHAYYLQYKNVRADYLKAIWEIINWGNVAERFEKAAC